MIGELGEAATRTRFLAIGFQFDPRSRLEAGIDGIAEVMIDGEPSAKMIAVQVKSTRSGAYTSENDAGFFYLLETRDLDYWRNSNLPVIIVLYRESDNSFFWKSVDVRTGPEQRRLQFSKSTDALNRDSVDCLAALTVPKAGFGYYVPPLRGGETALVNLLPVVLPAKSSLPAPPSRAKGRLRNSTINRKCHGSIGRSGTGTSGHSMIPGNIRPRRLSISIKSRRLRRACSPSTKIWTSKTISRSCFARHCATSTTKISPEIRKIKSFISEHSNATKLAPIPINRPKTKLRPMSSMFRATRRPLKTYRSFVITPSRRNSNALWINGSLW
ncbi:DUF4365 domain-containing protein [Enterovirga sp.]|uniref:DUF4365 domain-containing protein n=1 Tax=Enterovirga sp. TaxID=2026350 RepID=UPI002BD1C7E0|nr:DUF4365 domain-containing protein [Enterovirga sp.]HMO31257.1 DUF4365 domain-containing protein [Enterovirga sp.]